MKKIILLFIPILLFIMSCVTEPETAEPKTDEVAEIPSKEHNNSQDYESLIYDMLNEICIIAEESENSLVKEIKDISITRFNQGDLHISYVEKIESMDEAVLGNASFSFFNDDESKPQYLTLEMKLLDLAEQYPSLVMSVIFHELAHAYSFYMDPSYHRSLGDNPLEKYLYEMDAIYAEALFMQQCRSIGYSLSTFEGLMIQSLEQNNLAYISHSILRKDNKLIWYLIGEKDRCLEGELSLSEYLSRTEELAVNLIQQWENIADLPLGEEHYYLLVSMRSFESFIAQIAAPVLTEDQVALYQNQVDRIVKLQQDCYTIIKPHWKWVEAYSDKIEEDYLLLWGDSENAESL